MESYKQLVNHFEILQLESKYEKTKDNLQKFMQENHFNKDSDFVKTYHSAKTH